MKLKVIFFFLFIIPFTAMGQLSISGMVQDSLSQKPIELCNIYLSGTTRGVTSDAQGKFKIDNLKPGNYTLVVSHVSYQISIRDVLVLNKNKDLGKISLLEEVDEVSSVSVESKKDRTWERRFNQFKKMMLGKDYSAKKIEFVNSYVAEFLRMKEGGFTRDRPFTLEIVNQYTGYRIYYDVQQFYIGKKHPQFITGYSKFEELEPENDEERESIIANRKKAYRGSLRHFFKHLLAGNHEENGYDAYVTNDAPFDQENVYVKKNIFKKKIKQDSIPYRFSIEDTKYDYIKKIKFQNYLHFEYWKEGTDMGQNQKTWVKAKNDFIFVFTNGVLLDPTLVTLYGFLTREGIYQLLPFDYEDPDSN